MATDLDFLLSLPVFSFFTRRELEAAEKLFNEVAFAKDDIVVRIGEPGDTFFVVLEGELDVWDASEPPRQTGTLRRGDYFGEMALLQGGKRTATVTVARRTRMLVIDKPTFTELFLKSPKATEYFARILSKRLAGVTRAETIRRATTTIAVASPRGLKGETLVAYTVAVLLKQLTQTEVAYVEVRPAAEASQPMVLDLLSESTESSLRRLITASRDEVPAVLKISVQAGRDAAGYGDTLSNLIAQLSETFSFIVIDLGSICPPLIDSAPAYSDVFISIVDHPDEPSGVTAPRSMKVHKDINLFNPTSRPISISHSEPFVIPYSPMLERPAIEASGYIRSNPRSAPGLPLHRLAHKLLGTSIGLALGGAAAGFHDRRNGRRRDQPPGGVAER